MRNKLSQLSLLFLFFFYPHYSFASDLHTLLKTKSCIKCDLSYSDLNYSVFRNGDLSGSDLSYLNASRSSFTNYSFRSANLSNANFKYARLIASDFRNVIFENAIFYKTIVTNSHFDYETVPAEIIINSIDFPLNFLPRERINSLLETVSPESHTDFYLTLLNHLKTLSPEDPSVSLLLANFYYYHQFDYNLFISSLQNASVQFKQTNQIDKAKKVIQLIEEIEFKSKDAASIGMPRSRANGLGISAVEGIQNLFKNLLPAITSFGFS